MALRLVIGLLAAGALWTAAGCTCGDTHERQDAASSDGAAFDAARAIDAGLDAPPTARWRWSSPTPAGNSLSGVWGAAADDVWAVGTLGTILHFDGATWSAVPSGTTTGLNAVWGSGADDVWAVGGESFWTFTDEGTGVLLHWDGTRWSTTMPGSRGLFGVWGTSASDVWAVGHDTILHYDGATWTRQPTDMPYALYSVYAAAPDDVWAVGDYWPVLHYDGSTWTAAPDGLRGIGATGAVWGTGADDVWTSSLIRGRSHWDGNAWSTPGSTGVVAFGGTGADDVWGVGGGITHFDGSAWSGSPSPTEAPLRAVWASARDDAWAVGDAGTILHFDGTTWTRWAPIAPNVRFEGVWASAVDDVWAVGWEQRVASGGTYEDYGVIYRGDGVGWSRMASAMVGPSYDLHFEDVWGSAADDVWAVGESGMIHHFDGLAWSAVASSASNRIDGIWGTSSTDVWAAGYDGVHHWDGTSWTRSDATPLLAAVWASAESDVWAVGDSGVVRHFDGSAWSTVTIDVLAGVHRPFLRAIWGSSAEDLWIAAGVIPAGMGSVTSGLLLHRVGTTWTSIPSPAVESLWGSGANDVWAVGERTLHYDGVAWTEHAEPPLDAVGLLYDIAGHDADHVWAVGSAAYVLQRSP
ncbi:MAG: hypothetical protein K1X94_32140 [Sandaracinaceae bacterium]|nr:hypothetical protein [Sandaracinaceae bacterium]